MWNKKRHIQKPEALEVKAAPMKNRLEIMWMFREYIPSFPLGTKLAIIKPVRPERV